MRYTKFIIKNFKGINDLTIDLSKQPQSRIYTFIGLNESGKTTILEAINTIQDGYNKNEAHRFIPKHLKANFTDKVSVEAIVEVDIDDNVRIENKFKELGYKSYQYINNFSINTTCSFENSKAKDFISYWDFSPVLRKAKSRKDINLNAETDDWQAMVKYIRENLMPRIVYYENFCLIFQKESI